MAHRLRRREFLAKSGRAALGFSLFQPIARAQAKSAESKDVASLIPDLERLIPRLMAEANVPGASIAVVKDGKLFWRKGFGVRNNASKGPVDNDTVFEAASVSKTVFAYAAMKLCENGVIGLDTPLTKYAPKPFLEGDPRLEFITARHVLSHTSGFQNFRSGQEPLRIHFTPGEKFLYSGEGYYYLQSVVTHLTGRSNPESCATYEAGLEVCATDIGHYMKANLLVPFGMASSGYLWSEAFEKRAARPHDLKGEPLDKGKPRASDAARYAAVGGLHTTPTDYARFLSEVVDPKPSDSFRLNQKSLSEMVRPHVKVDASTSWALGWQIRHAGKGNLIQHQGGHRGFQAFATASLETKAGYIIMTNGDNGWKVFYDAAFVDVIDRLF